MGVHPWELNSAESLHPSQNVPASTLIDKILEPSEENLNLKPCPKRSVGA